MRWGVALAVGVVSVAHAQDVKAPLALQHFPSGEVFLIDTGCSAAFRLMADFGEQRGSELAEVYAGAAGFMAGNAVAQHQQAFGTPPATAKDLIRARTVAEHAAYWDGLQHEDPATAAAELQRFTQDVTFCNARLRAYEAAIEEAKKQQ